MRNRNIKWERPIFKTITKAASELGVACYVIGGYVRDLFLNRPNDDIDIVVIGSGIELASKVRDMLGEDAKLTVYQNYGTAQVKCQDLELEFVGARKEFYHRESRKPIVEDGTLEDDQNRRDFTINAMAIGLSENEYGQLLDPFNGLQDLENKIIRTPLDPNITFSDDPLRMLRCIRFATQLGFTVEDNTYQAISTNLHRLDIISRERIIIELNKILKSAKPSIGVKMFFDTGMILHILPDMLKPLAKYKQKYICDMVDNAAHHNFDLNLMYAALVYYPERNYINLSRMFAFMKAPTKTMVPYIDKICSMTRDLMNHVTSDDNINEYFCRRFLYNATSKYLNDILNFTKVVINAFYPPKKRGNLLSQNTLYLKRLSNIKQHMEEIDKEEHLSDLTLAVNGDDIMEAFNITEGQKIGVLKQYAIGAILDGRVKNDKDSILFLLKTVEDSLARLLRK